MPATAPTLPVLSPAQLEAFHHEIRELRAGIDASLGPADFAHLKKIERWGRVSAVLGWLTAWIAPNPLSALLLSLGRSTRWLLMHHVAHRGYDRVPNVPVRYTSKGFAKGSRRFLDWCDWILPEAWSHEHNVLHHSHTGEERDPDLLERNSEFLRASRAPRWVRAMAILGLGLGWRAIYYSPRTLDVYLPVSRKGRPYSRLYRHGVLWLWAYLPYVAINFALIPLLFTPLGFWAVASAAINSFLADVFTSVHTFLVVGPNHTGDDLYRFEDPPASRAEHYFRQVIGSTNYRVGGDVTDYLHLWLNYQIEHHLFPDIPMLRYREVQPKVKALCEKYGIPYVQEGVLRRFGKLLDITTGKTCMLRLPPTVAQTAPEASVAHGMTGAA